MSDTSTLHCDNGPVVGFKLQLELQKSKEYLLAVLVFLRYGMQHTYMKQKFMFKTQI